MGEQLPPRPNAADVEDALAMSAGVDEIGIPSHRRVLAAEVLHLRARVAELEAEREAETVAYIRELRQVRTEQGARVAELEAAQKVSRAHIANLDNELAERGELAEDLLARVGELEAERSGLSADRGTSMIWCLVDIVHDDEPTTGPFDTYDAAAAHDPYDDRFEPRRIPLAEWDARPGRRETTS